MSSNNSFENKVTYKLFVYKPNMQGDWKLILYLEIYIYF